jgi:hypothetical protein
MSSVVWAVGAVVVCGVLLYVAYVLEPYWVARDGTRFLTTSETVDRHGTTVGHRREVRGTLLSDGTVMLGKRSLMRTKNETYRVRGKSPEVSHGRFQYVLEQVPLDPLDDLLILRLPTSSPLRPTFDELAARASAQEA